MKGTAQSPLVVSGRARFEPRAHAPDQMLFGQSALADEFLCHPQAWFLDPEVSAGSTHWCQTKCHKSRLSCLPLSWERKSVCSGGFWASLSPTYQPGKKQTLEKLT